MTLWIISYHKDNNTSTLELEAPERPTPEQACAAVLDWAEDHLPAGEYAGSEAPSREPAMRLLKRYGVTITGIAAR
ncbi:hypothetical protein ACWKWZ_22385 [Metapseudomonas otitidis]|jgi:hypothetical protein|uniref:Uncharacterized protein n=2 Tax=Metapseudomonas otitidis TaxID=319939 RepID=A0A1I0UGT1_9GAMM|nr:MULTISPECIES: hypothetical protein [Pseudomonas]MDL5594419.1 hypothetical protein [Bacillus subtilis]MBO2928672.1 hypothetical protein [Pseudomonas otitidis]MCO7557972.1 hypothetical protein [Pseudomonas otitidis]MCP1616513.1 hypothetical protein [Pseudomonas otitidis]MDG9783751.1 hypothetical protein [Pseudomonas otitidis]